MNNKKTDLNSFPDLINDKYILEADPTPKEPKSLGTVKPKQGFGTWWKKGIAIAACLALLMTVIFSIASQNSPFYSPDTLLEGTKYKQISVNISKLISKMNENQNDGWFGDDYPLYPEGAVPEGDASGNIEITDNQVSGVEEGDLIKRTASHIFYLSQISQKVYAYSINGENTECCNEISISSGIHGVRREYIVEMLLSPNGKSLTVMSEVGTKGKKYVSVKTFDVSDPYNISLTDEKIFENYNYVTARYANGELYLILSYRVVEDLFDENDISTFIPKYPKGDENVFISGEKIYCPEEFTGLYYNCIFNLSQENGEVNDCFMIPYSISESNYYFAQNNIYYYTDKITVKQDDSRIIIDSDSYIGRISYENSSFEYGGTVFLEGRINNRYSMDEYEGILRVFTTDISDPSGVDVMLFLIDISDMSVKNQISGFAPKGDEVKSVRFNKEIAYCCTALRQFDVFIDPVFIFDLSDINNITYKETDEMPGFSSSLIDMGGGILLGVGSVDGYGKLETYTAVGNKVEIVDTYKLTNGFFEGEYKSYYIDREFGYIGIPFITNGDTSSNFYSLFKIKDGKFELISELGVPGMGYLTRGVLIDGYLYVMCDQTIQVVDISTNTVVYSNK